MLRCEVVWCVYGVVVVVFRLFVLCDAMFFALSLVAFVVFGVCCCLCRVCVNVLCLFVCVIV